MPEVLVVSTPGARIYTRQGVVYVKPLEGDPVPVTQDTDLVVIAAGASSVSGRALRRLAELGVRVLVLGHRGHVVAEMRPLDRHNRSVEARLAQYEAKLRGRGAELAAEMVRAKIVNQARLLRYLAKSRREPWLRDASYEVESFADRLRGADPEPDTVRAIEARAAHAYWQALAALLPARLGFTGRSPRGGDPVNMALSYGYAILYGIAHDALILAGLDPYAGFLHTDRSGKPSLVYDYSDTYKPAAVDRALFLNTDPGLFETTHGSLTYQARRAIATRVLKALTTPLRDRKEYRRRQLREHIHSYAWSLAAALREKKPYQAFEAVL